MPRRSLPATPPCSKRMPQRKPKSTTGTIEKESAEAGTPLRAGAGRTRQAQPELHHGQAPFDGRIGRHLVNPGNVVGAMGQQTSLAQIDQIDPIYVYFTINERDLLRIIERMKHRRRPALEDRRRIPVYFGLSNEEGYPHEGRLDFASISVAPTTGTLQLRGIFPNPDRTHPARVVRAGSRACAARSAMRCWFRATRSASISKANISW